MVTKEYYDIIEFAELIQKNSKTLYFQLDWSKENKPCLSVLHVSGFGIIVGIPYTDAPVISVHNYNEIDEYDLGEKLDKYFASLSKSHDFGYDRKKIRLRGMR